MPTASVASRASNGSHRSAGSRGSGSRYRTVNRTSAVDEMLFGKRASSAPDNRSPPKEEKEAKGASPKGDVIQVEI